MVAEGAARAPPVFFTTASVPPCSTATLRLSCGFSATFYRERRVVVVFVRSWMALSESTFTLAVLSAPDALASKSTVALPFAGTFTLKTIVTYPARRH